VTVIGIGLSAAYLSIDICVDSTVRSTISAEVHHISISEYSGIVVKVYGSMVGYTIARACVRGSA
jgi:hypothetical protein